MCCKVGVIEELYWLCCAVCHGAVDLKVTVEFLNAPEELTQRHSIGLLKGICDVVLHYSPNFVPEHSQQMKCCAAVMKLRSNSHVFKVLP